MKSIQAPLAHLINKNAVRPHSKTLLEMVENGIANGEIPLTFLDRCGNETHRSYQDILDGAQITATYLKNRGLQSGDKVILILMTGDEFIHSFFGTLLAGGIPVTASPPLTMGNISKYLHNLSHIVRNSEAKFMISFPRISKVIGRVLAGDNQLTHFILAKDIQREKGLNHHSPSIDPEQPAFIQYTSGSTGLPKGAVLSHRALLASVYGMHKGVDCQPGDTTVSWLPLFHDMGLIGALFTSLYSKAHLYAMTPEAFVRDPVSWLKFITRYKASFITAPNFAYHLCASRIKDEDLFKLDFSHLRLALNGAEPVDLKTLNTFEEKFGPVGFGQTVAFPAYGMAENCLAATFPKLGERFEVEFLNRTKLELERQIRPASEKDSSPYCAISVGSPIAGQEVAIEGAGGKILNENQVGEILVKSPSLMTHYYNNPEATKEILKNGWLHTGDLGFINKGRLFVTGRAKEMIIKRGRNYYPYDIERAAGQVKGVRKGCLAAFSCQNPHSGTEDLVLVAETREKHPQVKDQIKKEITSEILGSVGIKPDRVLVVPPRSIPKTSSGKIQRLMCKQFLEDGTLVKNMPDRILTPMKTMVGSLVGRRKFKKRSE